MTQLGCPSSHSRPRHTPIGRGSGDLLHLRMWCSGSRSGANGAVKGITAALVSMQAARLLPRRTRNAAEATAGPNATAMGADTDENENENGRVCVGGLGPNALAAAHDATGLSVVALTASAHTNRPAVAAKAASCCPCHALAASALLFMSEHSGCADRNRPSVDAAGSCSYLSDCMSLPAHQHLLSALCWLAW